MKTRRSRTGITAVEAAFISSITILLGFVLIFLASGWAQISLNDLTKKADEHIQSFRSLLAIEAIRYTESDVEIRLRNISKWNISLTIMEIEALMDGKVVGKFSKNVSLARGEATSLPIPADCKYGKNMIARIKYIPTALSEKDLPPLAIEFDFMCPISTIPPVCNVPEEWSFIDIMNPITTLSGEISQEYSYIWIRTPLSSMSGDRDIKVQIYGQEGSYSGSSTIRFPSAEQTPLKISGEGVKPPYNITFTGSYYIPRSFLLGALVEEKEVKAHVSGITILWRPEDKIAEGLIIELGVFAPGDYVLRVSIEDCHGYELLTLEKPFSYEKRGWILLHIEFTEEFKVTDMYTIKTSIIRGG